MPLREGEKMSDILIKGARVIDPASGIDDLFDIIIAGGKIKELAKGLKEDSAKAIDATGLIALPGLIDMHVHLREPGREDEETIESGAKAAAFSGFTTIASMPNTDPPNDSPVVTTAIVSKAKEAGFANVLPLAAITKGLSGKDLTEMGLLLEAGAVAFSDDGRSIQETAVMRRALEYAKMFDATLIIHAEDESLSFVGQIAEGLTATRLGLKGIPASSEEVIVARDIILAKETGSKVHFTHLSSKGSVDLIREAKKIGVKVTSDVTPHHLTLTHGDIKGYDSNFKVSPPLRGESDRAALREGLLDGTIDAIASDHAPHSAHEKDGEFESAPFGMAGLETTLPLLITELVTKGAMPIETLIEKVSASPARILGIDKGSLRVGADADIIILNDKAQVEVDPSKFISKSRNTPFAGRIFKGRVETVIIGGRIIKNLLGGESD